MDRVGTIGYVGNEDDVRVASDLVDKARDALIDYQVGLDPGVLMTPLVKIVGTGRKTTSHT